MARYTVYITETHAHQMVVETDTLAEAIEAGRQRAVRGNYESYDVGDVTVVVYGKNPNRALRVVPLDGFK